MLRPLTALRFVFALMVFLAHCVFYLPGGKAEHPATYSLLYEGFIGVSFFFILSGFILAYRYAGPLRADGIRIETFWIRRWTRIYPVYACCLLLTAALLFRNLQQDPAGYFRELGLHLTMLQTLVGYGRYAFGFNGPAWSVADEMVFYLSFPLLIRLSGHPRAWNFALILGMGAIVYGMWQAGSGGTDGRFYSNPLIRLLDFSLGIALYNWYHRHRDTSWSRLRGNLMESAALLLLIVFVALRGQVPLLWRYSVYYWAPMLLLIYVFAKGAGGVSGWLGGRLPVLLGEASYSFYLFHLPAGILCAIAFRRLGLQPAPLVFTGCYFLFTLGGSLLLFRYLERPLTRKLRQRLIDRRRDG